MNQKEIYDKILYWLSNSNIRDKNGAVYSWLNPQKEGYIYPEIIGYYIKLFSYLYSVEKDEKFKDLAVASADYISSILSENGAISRDDIKYVFDTGICLSGILSLKRINSLKENHKRSIDLMARFIKDSLLKKIPSFKENKPLIDNSRWSLSYGSLLIKTAISLIEYGEYSNDKTYLDLAKSLINDIIDKTFREDHFSINEYTNKTYAHPHCYATEGLCFMNSKGYGEYTEIIQKSAQWLAKAQNEDGSINNWHYNKDVKKEGQGDATAQSVRIWLFTDKDKYRYNIDKAVSFLGTLQSSEGGLYYNSNSRDVNSWVTMFALQALYWDIKSKTDFNWIV